MIAHWQEAPTEEGEVDQGHKGIQHEPEEFACRHTQLKSPLV